MKLFRPERPLQSYGIVGRGGTLVWYAPPEEGWASPEEVAQEALMPGHLIQGGDTRRIIPKGIPDRGIPQAHATATPARNA